MSSSATSRKVKINLSDYSYRQDIENRIMLAQLSVFEVAVLQEIVHHSLNISIEHLAKEMDFPIADLIPILDKLSETKLFKRQQMKLIVDKEIRKFFEFQILKFDDHFQPGLNFLQNALSQVPIHLLPLWYSISRSSDNIFESIVDQYLTNPTVYRQYLNELQFDDPTLKSIMNDVFHAPDFKMTAHELMTKHQLTRPSFEEYILLLEYHFVCCLSYNRIEDSWQEVVTPFAEWLEYLQFEKKNIPIPLRGGIQTSYYTDFNFIKDLNAVLLTCEKEQKSPLELKNLKVNENGILQIILEKLVQVGFLQQTKEGSYISTEKGKLWLTKQTSLQISNLAVDPLNASSNSEFESLWNMRNLYLIEKSLRRLPSHEWIDFEDFFKGFTVPIGDKEPVTLKMKGTKWKFAIPTYSDLEKKFVQQVIMERLAELGVVSTGLYHHKPCFKIN